MNCLRIYFLFLLLLFSCQNKKITEDSQPSKQELPNDFVSFYAQFLSDSSYQVNHVLFPLAGRNDSISSHWQQENWSLHVPFDTSMINFNQQFLNIENIIIEKIEDKNGYFVMERRFSQLGEDGWQLIYYSIRGPKQ